MNYTLILYIRDMMSQVTGSQNSKITEPFICIKIMKNHVLESPVKSALTDTVLVLLCTASSIINKDLVRWVL